MLSKIASEMCHEDVGKVISRIERQDGRKFPPAFAGKIDYLVIETGRVFVGVPGDEFTLWVDDVVFFDYDE